MSSWVRNAGGRLIYTGRLARGPFSAWTTTSEGAAALEAARARTRFALFGRARAARRRLWQQLAVAARQETVVALIQREIEAYLDRAGELAYAHGLPRLGVDLRRLVVVPRVLLNGAAYDVLLKQLNAQAGFASLEGGIPLRHFFVVTLIRAIETAIASARPSPGRPIASGKEWMTVGLDAAFVWRLPLVREPLWEGHHYVLESTREPVTRAVRKATAASIAQLEASLQTLSRTERNEILRAAVHAA
jgi:hypothetical protein